MSFELFCRQWNPQQAEEGNCLRPTGMQILDQLEAEVDDADSPRLPHRPIRRVFTSGPSPTSWTLCNSAIPALGRTHHLEGISPLWPPMSGKTIKLSLSQFSSVQSLSRVRLFATPWIAAHQAPLSITNPRVHPNSRPSSHWCHPAISSSVVPFSSCPQSLPASESFPMSQLFASGGQSIGVSALASFLPKNTQNWSPLEWTGWISLQSKGLSRVFSNTTVQKHQLFGTQLSSQSNFHIHTWPLEKP